MAGPQTNSLSKTVEQAGAFVGSLSTRQKFALSGGGLVVLLTLLIFVKLLAKPEMKPLYTGMNPVDTQAMAAKLAVRKIPYEIGTDGGSISVPAEQVEQIRLAIAVEGKPRSGRMGFEIFDKPNWATSDFNEKVNYQRALEGELERTIQTMEGVQAVRVHLVLPPDSVFSSSEREGKASVILSLGGSPLTRQTELAISKLVAGAVDRLAPEEVTVIDGDGNRVVSKEESGTNDGGGRTKEDMLAERLVKTLEPVVGLGRVRANVRLEYDLTSSEEQQESYDPKSAVALTMQRSEERSNGGGGGIAGTASNVPTGAAGVTGAAGKQSEEAQTSHSENSTYAVNKLVRHTIVPAGRIKRLAAAVLVDDEVETKKEAGRTVEVRRHRSPEQLKQIEDLARAAIGADASRSDLITVQNLPFQQVTTEAPAAVPLLKRVRNEARDWGQAIRYAAIGLLLLVVYATVLRPIKRQMMDAFKSARISLAEGRSRDTAAVEDAAASGLPQTSEFKQLGTLKKQLVEKVKSEPGPSTRLVQSWIQEGSER